MIFVLFNNIHQQLHYRDNYMSKFIDMQIEEYLKTDLHSAFEEEFIWNDISKIGFAITQLNILFKDKTLNENETELHILNKQYSEYSNKWFNCSKDKLGNSIDNTSKFMKLVKERMVTLNFDERLSAKCDLLREVA
jgi:hypothetical protein